MWLGKEKGCILREISKASAFGISGATAGMKCYADYPDMNWFGLINELEHDGYVKRSRLATEQYVTTLKGQICAKLTRIAVGVSIAVLSLGLVIMPSLNIYSAAVAIGIFGLSVLDLYLNLR